MSIISSFFLLLSSILLSDYTTVFYTSSIHQLIAIGVISSLGESEIKPLSASTYRLVRTQVLISLKYLHRNRMAKLRIIYVWLYKNLPNWLQKWLWYFAFISAMCERFSGSLCLGHCQVVVLLFDGFSWHSNEECVIVSHCGFNMHFPKWYWIHFPKWYWILLFAIDTSSEVNRLFKSLPTLF